MGILMSCLASAAMASTASSAVATEAPVTLPLQGLETAVPALDAPTVHSGVPLPVPGAPAGLHEGAGGGLPDAGLPRVPIASSVPQTLVDAPLPELLDGSESGDAQLTTPGSDVQTATPGAVVGTPVSTPAGSGPFGLPGLPGLSVPEAGVLTPSVTGALDPTLGIQPPGL
ncbi:MULTISPECIES: hypothetical protein [Streptomyces]|uniref:Secreted protein n=1 Tax=Streptomyces solicathayae TaxID=3081768 RepID=A0ABZ0LSG7_9ACTN|nr:hypothetical protein [Streptomyces sp. HUAS YS2]WOX22396.1 hypothetical protein R2D22_13705 [Streptomyces sp. HUAS YS2]